MHRLTRRRFAMAAAASVAVPAALGPGRSGHISSVLADHDGALAEGGQDPTIAVDPASGTIYVAWFQPAADDHTEGESSDHHAMSATGALLLARSTDGGETWTEPIAASGDDADVTSLVQCSPLIAIGKAGEVYVVYMRHTDHAGVDFGRYSLRLARSLDGGATFDPAVEVFADPIENGAYHDLLVGPEGELYVSWLSYWQYMPESGVTGEQTTEVRIARSDDGGLTFGPSVQVDGLSCECCRTSLALGQDGVLSLAWRNQEPQAEGDPIRNHVIARSTDRGQTWDTPNPIHDDAWRFNQCPESGPALRFDTNGGLHAIWFTGVESGPGVYYAVSHDGGLTFGAPTTLVTDDYFPHSNVAITVDNHGDAWVAFDDVRPEFGSVKVVRIAADGTTEAMTSEDMTGQTPAVAASPNGPLLTWLDGEAVRVMSLASHGH
jgi:hypothetical protein